MSSCGAGECDGCADLEADLGGAGYVDQLVRGESFGETKEV